MNSSEHSGAELSRPVSSIGKKYDAGKAKYHLIDDDAEAAFVDVLTFGAEKYGEQNWREVDNAADRYFSAVRRHLRAWRGGERLDPETGLPHLAHAACGIHFLLALDIQTSRQAIEVQQESALEEKSAQ